jgi:hypothetical protein
MSRHALFIALASLVLVSVVGLVQQLLLAPVWEGFAEAQQPVNVTRVNNAVPLYDPCLDPSKVVPLTYGTGLAAASGAVTHTGISGTTRIYFCSAKVQGGATGTITLRFGTGANCATFPTDIDVTSIVANGDGALITPGAAGTYLRSAPSQALCSVRSASMTIHLNIRYVQEN